MIDTLELLELATVALQECDQSTRPEQSLFGIDRSIKTLLVLPKLLNRKNL
jgi:hypothetical protein